MNKRYFILTILLITIYLVSSSCSGQKELTEDRSGSDSSVPQEVEPPDENSEDFSKEIDENPFISGFIELEESQAVGDTIRSRLSEANIRISDTTGLGLYRGQTNTRGEFYVELDDFEPEEPFELFIHSPRENIYRNILFIYKIENKDDMRITLNKKGGTKLNIDYLDLATGKGSGTIITN